MLFREALVADQLIAVYHQAWTGDAHTWHDGDGGALARGDDPRRLYGHPALREAARGAERGHRDGEQERTRWTALAAARAERVAREIESARALRDEDRGNEGKEEL